MRGKQVWNEYELMGSPGITGAKCDKLWSVELKNEEGIKYSVEASGSGENWRGGAAAKLSRSQP